MSPSPPTSTPASAATGWFGRLIAWTGGVVFLGSITSFLLAYRQYGQPEGPWSADGWAPTIFNTLMFSLFALHHSVFARTGLKARIAARVGALERSLYVWLSSGLFLVTIWFWQPVPGMVWSVEGPARWLMWSGVLLGVLLTAVAAAAIDPLELAGIRQAQGRPLQPTDSLSTSGLYGFVRHPIYLGWVLMVWCVPVMTGTRLVFAAVSTLYLILAIPFEERALRRAAGAAYDDYARTVRWRMLPGLY